jgi:chromate transporter
VKIVFYGLRATIIGMIIFAAIKFAVSNGIIGGTKNFIDIKSFVIMIGAFLLLIKSKINPILLIFLAGILGEFCFLINEY